MHVPVFFELFHLSFNFSLSLSISIGNCITHCELCILPHRMYMLSRVHASYIIHHAQCTPSTFPLCSTFPDCVKWPNIKMSKNEIRTHCARPACECVCTCAWRRTMKRNLFVRKGKLRKSIDLKLCIINGNTTTSTTTTNFLIWLKEKKKCANDRNWSNRLEHLKP